MRVIRKSQLGKLSRNSHYVTFFFIFLVSSKVEFLLNKELCTLFYFYQAGYTNVDRCLMRYFIRYNWVRKQARWSEPCCLACYPIILPAGDFPRWCHKRRLSFWPYNKCSIGRACSVKMGLILGVKTCEPHKWRKTINTKKPVRSQHNRAKENNSQKTKKNFTGFYTKDDPKMAGYWPLSFLRFYWPGLRLDPLKKHMHEGRNKKELGQYPDIVTSRLLKNALRICWTSITLSPCCEISELSG